MNPALLDRIANESGTPTFVYDAATIETAFRAIHRALSFAPHLVAYAMKANDNLAILSLIEKLGGGADIVSGGELARCQKVGISPSRIVYSGVGKSAAEIGAALAAKVRSIHVESEPELALVSAIAKSLGVIAPIGLRINPDVDAATHPYIATGLHSTKFGIELDVAKQLLPRIVRDKHVKLETVGCHIGSQIGAPDSLRQAVAITAKFGKQCREAGAPIQAIDAGGGWPVAYGDEKAPVPPPEALGKAIADGLADAGAADLGWQVIVEPGRALVAEAGTLLTRVLFIKEQGSKRFIIVDAAITELIRPALYGAYHAIEPVQPREGTLARCDVVGPVCETGDFLARDRELRPLEPGDLLVVRTAGAYAASMSSQYNARPRAAEVLVEGDRFRTIRARETHEDLWRNETV